jgi:putative transcriptional regulator
VIGVPTAKRPRHKTRRIKLIELRRRLGESQEQMARRVGVSYSHWRQIETGGRTPSLELATRIARIFNVPVEELFPPSTDLPQRYAPRAE